MANVLKMATVHAILALSRLGWSHRRIARELDIHRETVSRYVQCRPEDSKPASNAPLGSETAKPATNAPTGSETDMVLPGPPSCCEPLRQIIEEKLEQGLSARRIWQDIGDEHGFSGSYYSVRRFVKRLGGDRQLPFRRMETAPGQEAQVDFGKAAPVVRADGRRRHPHVLRIVLSHSRKAYSEAIYHQTTENFIRCLENAFWHIGGVPRTLIIDNLKAAVAKADWYDPDVHPIIQSFCEHYGTVILPTKPYTPRHKGKVERGVCYVKDNGLKGRTFGTLQQENQYLLDWESRVADTRIHGTTRQQVGKLFREQEKPHLLSLPPGRFPCFREAQRSVHRDGHIEVAKAYYSVPPEYVGRLVWARWDGHLVRIFNSRMESIAVHSQVEPGTFQTRQQHISAQKVSKVEKGTVWLLRRTALIGSHTEQWARTMLEKRGIPGVRVLVGLLNLAGRYDDDQIDQACEIALTHGAFRLKTLREILKRDNNVNKQLQFIDEHPIIRSLSEYGSVVQASLQTR